ncbi:hypothetical protein PLCT1_02541 [Planctomycetaceae bacterium]|nr:hypothetical protein PLCT1_02541 [Planctomycetaceae bacterium]
MRVRLAFLCAAMICATIATACTSAIVSGRVTRDGRPLLWKQRDTGVMENKLVYDTGGTYRYLGVHDLTDVNNEECFMGSNEAGFSIINTASYNLRYAAYSGPMDEEGKVMREALATCRTLADFERLLQRTAGKRGVEANFGVIDASGGAAYYETDPWAYVKYDVNDPGVAPQGYLLRTNFSMSGPVEKGQGYIRYEAASALFSWARLGSGIGVEMILLDGTCDLKHALVGTDLTRDPLPANEETRSIVNFTDFIPRYTSVGSMIIQGVRQGEDAAATTLWTVLGSPLTTPVIPLWVAHAERIPAMMFSRASMPAALNARSLALKDRLFPMKTTEGRGYLDLARVMNRAGTGTVQRLRPVDREIMRRTAEIPVTATGLRTAGDVEALYRSVGQVIQEYYASYGL